MAFDIVLAKSWPCREVTEPFMLGYISGSGIPGRVPMTFVCPGKYPSLSGIKNQVIGFSPVLITNREQISTSRPLQNSCI